MQPTVPLCLSLDRQAIPPLPTALLA